MTSTSATQLNDLPGTQVKEPLLIGNPEALDWTARYDVVVVGLGAAGVAAAIEAADRGSKVAFVDCFNGGGTTARSGSVMYAGGGTALQERLGVKDDPDIMFRYLQHEVKGAVTDATLRRFCENSPENFAWAERNGVSYSGALFAKKTSYPVPGYSLYFSGNELIYSESAKPAPRGHLADGIKKFTAFGPAFIAPLIRSALKKGVFPQTQARVTRLVCTHSGEVVGVEAQQIPAKTAANYKHRYWSTLAAYAQIYYPPAARYFRAKIAALERRYAVTVRFQARSGVVLATGGFILNKELTEKYLPKYRRAMRLGTPGDLGSGLALGVSAGGIAERLSTATAWRFINPPVDWPKGALVNLQGKRYINEAMYGATIGTTMMEENNGEAVLILDKPLFDASVANLNLQNTRLVTLLQAKSAVRIAKSADTLEALAAKCKIDPQGLRETITQYNASANGSAPDAFGKAREDMAAIEQGPFYALNMSVGKGDITSVITLGGLRVCEGTGAVFKADGSGLVPGLYAAGRTAIGVASNAYISGLSIADGVFSGRRAGEFAAKRRQEIYAQEITSTDAAEGSDGASKCPVAHGTDNMAHTATNTGSPAHDAGAGKCPIDHSSAQKAPAEGQEKIEQ
ncbi:3-ketosteroid-delta4(5alpha)-dehydrogenase [gamma proteobacterium HdN1]|nr:3-ketosteroid-delta4(5alpha)-dehydrogenase [gamma proteobacterium HdN1]